MEDKTVQAKKGMPKQTLIFVTFLIVITLLLLGLSVYKQKPFAPAPKPNQQVTFPSYAHTTLTLTPPISTAYSPNSYSANITIDTGGDKITAAQLELTYDPKVLTNIKINPGTFIQNPVVLLKKVDPGNGRISLAIGIHLGQTPPTGAGTLAVITFDEIPTATGSTIINFLPKTEVTAVGVAQSVLKTSTGNLFFVNQKESPAPALNSGTTSAQ